MVGKRAVKKPCNPSCYAPEKMARILGRRSSQSLDIAAETSRALAGFAVFHPMLDQDRTAVKHENAGSLVHECAGESRASEMPPETFSDPPVRRLSWMCSTHPSSLPRIQLLLYIRNGRISRLADDDKVVSLPHRNRAMAFDIGGAGTATVFDAKRAFQSMQGDARKLGLITPPCGMPCSVL